MITRLTSPAVSAKNTAIKTSPAFGFAKLNEIGKNSADEFGYTRNSFINGDLFKKQGFFSTSALTKELGNGVDFKSICSDYGCTKNGKANAEFIRTQILSGKSNGALSTLDNDSKTSGLKSLFEANFDNPDLSKNETNALLNLLKDNIPDADYVRYAGILKVGSDK